MSGCEDGSNPRTPDVLTTGWWDHCFGGWGGRIRPGGGRRTPRTGLAHELPPRVPKPKKKKKKKVTLLSTASNSSQSEASGAEERPCPYVDSTKTKSVEESSHQDAADEAEEWREGAGGGWGRGRGRGQEHIHREQLHHIRVFSFSRHTLKTAFILFFKWLYHHEAHRFHQKHACRSAPADTSQKYWPEVAARKGRWRGNTGRGLRERKKKTGSVEWAQKVWENSRNTDKLSFNILIG